MVLFYKLFIVFNVQFCCCIVRGHLDRGVQSVTVSIIIARPFSRDLYKAAAPFGVVSRLGARCSGSRIVRGHLDRGVQSVTILSKSGRRGLGACHVYLMCCGVVLQTIYRILCSFLLLHRSGPPRSWCVVRYNCINNF